MRQESPRHGDPGAQPGHRSSGIRSSGRVLRVHLLQPPETGRSTGQSPETAGQTRCRTGSRNGDTFHVRSHREGVQFAARRRDQQLKRARTPHVRRDRTHHLRERTQGPPRPRRCLTRCALVADFPVTRPRGSPAAPASARGGAACSSSCPRSGVCVRGSRRRSDRSPPKCGGGRRGGRSAGR